MAKEHLENRTMLEFHVLGLHLAVSITESKQIC